MAVTSSGRLSDCSTAETKPRPVNEPPNSIVVAGTRVNSRTLATTSVTAKIVAGSQWFGRGDAAGAAAGWVLGAVIDSQVWAAARDGTAETPKWLTRLASASRRCA